MGLIGHDDEALDVGNLVGDRLQQGHEHRVDTDEAVFGMVDDVHDLLGEQPRIDRMTHVSAAADAVVNLEVAVVIPGERCDAVALLYAEFCQRVSEPSRTRHGFADRVAMPRIVGGNRDYLAIAVEFFGMLRYRGDKQLRLHHQTFHDGMSLLFY